MNAFTGQTFQMNQIINLREVIEFTSISRAHIYEMINVKSKYYDPTFPRPIRLSNSRIGWVAREVNQWIEGKLQNRA
ncbi:MAG: AlpA family phage regulatory protein [Acinetobacter sp.]|jgi:prophage regulatory protein